MTTQFNPEPWPPATWRTTGTFPVTPVTQPVLCTPISKILPNPRRLRYQLPRLPVDMDHPFLLTGNLRLHTDQTTLVNLQGDPVGSIDLTTGIFVLELDKTPGQESRYADYWSGGRPIAPGPVLDLPLFP